MTSSDGSSGTAPEASGRRGSKVQRVIDDYGLDGLGAQLEAKWTDDSTDRYSLRELAEYVNQKLVEASIGPDSVEGEAENVYRLLTDDSVNSGVRTDAEAKIERNGVDVDTLRADFVSHQAVHTYLTEFRDTEFSSEPREPNDKLDDRRHTIRRLQDRLVAVSESSLRNLQNAGLLELGSFDVFVNVQVYCEDCRTQREIGSILEQRGCDCEDGRANP